MTASLLLFAAAAALLLSAVLALGLRPLFRRRAEGEASAATAPRRTLIALLLALSAAAVLLYAWLGNPAALQPLPAPGHGMDAAQVEEMVARLAARMEQDPGNPKGWTMLARAYRAMGRFDEAEKAFGHLAEEMRNDPGLLADYAELLAARADGNFDAKARSLIAQALKLDPDHPQALALAGTDAYQRGEYAAAIAHWERLLPRMPQSGEETEALRGAILKARRQMAPPAGDAPAAGGGQAKP